MTGGPDPYGRIQTFLEEDFARRDFSRRDFLLAALSHVYPNPVDNLTTKSDQK